MPISYASHCDGCPYEGAKHLPSDERFTRSTPLSMEDNDGTILLVFQAPGISEWLTGRPMSSTAPRSAGMRLAAAFAYSEKSRSDYNITNSVQCFPGKQKVVNSKRPRDRTPLTAARRQCTNWLFQDLTAHEYKHVVVFGSIAKQAVLSLTIIDTTSFKFIKHPSGGLSDATLREAVGKSFPETTRP